MSSSSRNVNFPENLDISPSSSIYPDDRSRPLTDASSLDGTFGYAAQRDAIEKYGIAGRIWEAAYMLNIYVDPPSNMEFDPPFIAPTSVSRPLTILELGSGAGMTSSRIAETLDFQDILVATDLPEVCPLLESNLRTHASSTTTKGSVYVRPLAWGDDSYAVAIASELLTPSKELRTLTHVVCSDLVYFPELLAPLLRSLLQLTSPPFSVVRSAPNPGVTVAIAYKVRSQTKETPFWVAFGLWFTFEPVLVKETSSGQGVWRRLGSSSEDAMFIFVAHRRPESYTWKIPAQDIDLLAGRGAWGTDAAKADDAFETLLFMTLESGEPEGK